MEVARTWLPRILALVAFCLYAILAPPGLYWLDAGELGAAAIGLGSPHPTGFPLYCVTAHAATWLPVGELAFRVELLSAGCAALAVLWTTRLVLALSRNDVGGVVGAAAAATTLATSLVFLRQATVIEVYAPAAALIAGTLVLFDRVARGGDARWGLALAIVCGLGLSVHITYALLGPPVLILLVVRLRRGARWPLLAPLLCIATVAGMLSYLPVRSATDRVDAIDWGHPDNAERLLDHATARRIRQGDFDHMLSSSPAVLAHNAGQFREVIADSLGPFTLLAAMVGVIWLIRRRTSRWLPAAILWLGMSEGLYAVWIHPMGQQDLQNGVVVSMALCIAAGVGLAYFARVMGRVGPYAAAVAGFVAATPAALHAFDETWPAARSDGPRAWAEASLASTPPRGITLARNDSTAAGLMFLTVAEGARPDVVALVRQHVVEDRERTVAMLARSGVGRPFDARTPYDSLLRTGRALRWEIGDDASPRETRLQAGAPLSLVVPIDEPGNRPAAIRGEIRAAVDQLEALMAGEDDRIARRVHAHALTSLGRLAYGQGDVVTAELLFDSATRVRPEQAQAWINLGVAASRQGRIAAALAHTERALEIEPVRTRALINATRYAVQLGDDPRAQRHIDRALGIAPHSATAWALAALLDLRAGERERAIERLDRAYTLDPRDRDTVDLLRQLEAREPGGAPREPANDASGESLDASSDAASGDAAGPE